MLRSRKLHGNPLLMNNRQSISLFFIILIYITFPTIDSAIIFESILTEYYVVRWKNYTQKGYGIDVFFLNRIKYNYRKLI